MMENVEDASLFIAFNQSYVLITVK